MDWVAIPSAALVVLNGLVLWFWKPWANAYAGEKGKNLARKEDLDEILAEVRAVTATQKEIEAKISMGLWRDQRRWEECREAYVRILEWADKVYQALLNISPKPAEEHAAWVAVTKILREFGTEFRRAKLVGGIFLPHEAIAPFMDFVVDTLDNRTRPDSIDIAVKRLSAAQNECLDSARRLFGAPPSSTGSCLDAPKP